MTNNETAIAETPIDQTTIDELEIDEPTIDETLINATTISVRELKAHASKLLKLLEEDSRSEIIITRHGRPCGKLVGLGLNSSTTSVNERMSLRNTMSHLANAGEKDLAEAKNIWGPGSDE